MRGKAPAQRDKSLEYFPDPQIILFGCRPHVPRRAGPCPVCGWTLDGERREGIRPGHDSHACAHCDAFSPKREAQLANARRSKPPAEHAADEADFAEVLSRSTATRQGKQRTLDERTRRRLWNGYARGGLDVELAGDRVTNRARVGRRWLTQIGQAPDWSIALDGEGPTIPTEAIA